MEKDLHFLCLMGRASRANRILGKLADREIAWQRSLLPQAQALKAEFLEKYNNDDDFALHRLRCVTEDAYDESFEKGMIHSLAIRLICHTEPKHESHVISYQKRLKEKAKRQSKRHAK